MNDPLLPVGTNRCLCRSCGEPEDWKKSPCILWEGAVTSAGYGLRTIGGKQYLVHRLVFEESHGHPPLGVVDHICRNKRCINAAHLRDASRAQNAANSPSRTNLPKGVWFCKQTGRYAVQITIDGKKRWLGRYDTPEKASKAYQRAAQSEWGRFNYEHP